MRFNFENNPSYVMVLGTGKIVEVGTDLLEWSDKMYLTPTELSANYMSSHSVLFEKKIDFDIELNTAMVDQRLDLHIGSVEWKPAIDIDSVELLMYQERNNSGPMHVQEFESELVELIVAVDLFVEQVEIGTAKFDQLKTVMNSQNIEESMIAVEDIVDYLSVENNLYFVAENIESFEADYIGNCKKMNMADFVVENIVDFVAENIAEFGAENIVDLDFGNIVDLDFGNTADLDLENIVDFDFEDMIDYSTDFEMSPKIVGCFDYNHCYSCCYYNHCYYFQHIHHCYYYDYYCNCYF